MEDKEYLSYIQLKYNLSKYEIQNCLQVDVETKIKQVQTQKEEEENRIVSIQKYIETLKKEPKTKKNVRKIFKLNNKLKKKNKNLSHDIVFGGKKLTQEISKLTNSGKNNVLLQKKKKQLKENRILPLYYVGSKNDLNSNRYFNFDFNTQTVIYKSDRHNHIEIKFKCSKKHKKYLKQLQEIKDTKLIPITVKLTTNAITFIFDEEKLNGFGFDKKNYKKELNDLSVDFDKKIIHSKFKDEQNSRKIKGKNENRYCAIDKNPEFYGVTILEKINDTEFKLIDKFCYGLQQISKKSKRNSSDKKSKYLTNKRKHEISCIYKDIFNKIKHYNCAYFIQEKLDFKEKVVKDSNKEFNRKTKNIWNRTLQTNLINKYCNENGIIIVDINACYTSIIGNLMYPYFDPINASIEIGRRGIFGFQEGKFYPNLTDTMIDTMILRFKSQGDVLFFKDCKKSWVPLCKKIVEAKYIYRRPLCDVNHKCFSKNHIKSGVYLYTFV
jgi:hypothetical protein